MKKITILLVLLMCCFACDKEETNPLCGAKANVNCFRNSHGTGFFSNLNDSLHLKTYYQPGSSTYRSSIQFYKWTENVCPEEHVKFSADIYANVDADFEVTSSASWYFLFEEKLQLTSSNDGVSRYWAGSDQFGLKQVYGDKGTGEFTLSATITFPYQGSFAADTMYLYEKLQIVTLKADYLLAKQQ